MMRTLLPPFAPFVHSPQLAFVRKAFQQIRVSDPGPGYHKGWGSEIRVDSVAFFRESIIDLHSHAYVMFAV